VKVHIPFKQRFREALLNDTKTLTSRTKRYGKKGDLFEAFGGLFLIISVDKMKLKQVAKLWREEGCNSQEDFINVWKQIHPRKGFDPEQEVFVHKFMQLKQLSIDQTNKLDKQPSLDFCKTCPEFHHYPHCDPDFPCPYIDKTEVSE